MEVVFSFSKGGDYINKLRQLPWQQTKRFRLQMISSTACLKKQKEKKNISSILSDDSAFISFRDRNYHFEALLNNYMMAPNSLKTD